MEFNEEELAEIRSIVPIRRHVHPCKDEVPPAAKTKEKRSNSRNSKNNAAAKAASSSKKKGGTTKKTTHKHKDGTAKKVAKSQKLKTRDANKKAKPKDNKGNISSQKRSHIDKHDKKNDNGSKAHKFVDKLAKRARRAESPEPDLSKASGTTSIKVGSDCTGYGSDFIALSLLNLNVSLVFVAERDAGKRELMRAAHRDVDWKNVIVYHDITKRNNEKAPYADVFYTGAPCQAYSQAGDRMALDDLQNRGVVIFHSIDYIRCQRPKVAIIENVKGLTMGANKEILETIIGILKDLGYTVEWKIVNTKDNGIPQSRPRVYIVAIRTRVLAKSIVFPKTIKCNLTSFIDVDDKRPSDEAPVSKFFTEAMEKATEKFGIRTWMKNG